MAGEKLFQFVVKADERVGYKSCVFSCLILMLVPPSQPDFLSGGRSERRGTRAAIHALHGMNPSFPLLERGHVSEKDNQPSLYNQNQIKQLCESSLILPPKKDKWETPPM